MSKNIIFSMLHMLSKIESHVSLSLFILEEIIESALTLQVWHKPLLSLTVLWFHYWYVLFINTLSLFFAYSINDEFQKDFEKWKLNIVLWRVNTFCPCVLSATYSLRFIFEIQHLKVLLWGLFHAACSSSLCGKSWLGLRLVSHMHQIVIQNKNTMIHYC